jgi:hypothetical protein
MKQTLLILGAALIAASLLPRLKRHALNRRSKKKPTSLDPKDLAYWLNLSDEEAEEASDKFRDVVNQHRRDQQP